MIRTTTRFDPQTYVNDLQKSWNQKDAQGFITKHYDANVEFTDPSGKPQRGTGPLRTTLDAWFGAFSEMKIQLVETVQTGNNVAMIQRCSGRHTGDFEVSPGEKIPATNKTATVDVADFVRINDQGKVVHEIVVLDTGRLLMQLGVMPGAGQAEQARRAVPR